jgi:hypothetical protein
MAEGPARDPTLANPSADDDARSDSGVESIAIMTSSPTRGAALMAKGEILELHDFFKKTSATDKERQTYHNSLLRATFGCRTGTSTQQISGNHHELYEL